MFTKRNVVLLILMLTLVISVAGCGGSSRKSNGGTNPEPAGKINPDPVVVATNYITIDFDKETAQVGDVITATIRIKEIENFSGCQVNIKFDPNVLQAINPITQASYGENTSPSSGDLLLNADYGLFKEVSNNIEEGILNFSKSYLNLEAYCESGKPESSGTVGIIGFKVLETNKTETNVKFEDVATMPNAISGTLLYDWNGIRLTDYQTLQPNMIKIVK